MAGREEIEKPDFMSEEDWAMIQDQTSSIDRIHRDGQADVEAYLANPKGRAAGSSCSPPLRARAHSSKTHRHPRRLGHCS